ncbi:LysO family transporter [Pelosinus sp. sgz500959]|uniref:LysO family transporter n=1 Tax=Pelosinus sp. sgz500959 TaxID=3242472 RepID=UPI00366DC020
MEIVIMSLLAGCLLGVSNIMTERWIGHLDKIIMVVLFILLIAVGIGIGNNQELINNLTLLGWKAMVIAILSTVGSVLTLWFVVSRVDFLKNNKIEEKQS